MPARFSHFFPHPESNPTNPNQKKHLGAKVEMTKASLDKMTDNDLEQTAERFRNEIDKMVTKKKKANPDFYAGYLPRASS